MADSIVSQHNLIRNALPLPQVTSRLINYATAVLISLLALGAVMLAYAALWENALGYGLRHHLAWNWALLIHFILIVFSLTFVRTSLSNERVMWPCLLTTLYIISRGSPSILYMPSIICLPESLP
jgi:hypothetical protein